MRDTTFFQTTTLAVITACVGVVLAVTAPVVAAQANDAVQLRQATRAQRVETRQAIRTDSVQGRQEAQVQRQEQRDLRISDRCDAVNDRISGVLEKHQNRADAHLGRHDHVVTIVSQVISKAEAEGLDTGKVAAALESFQASSRVFSASVDEYVSALKNTQSYTCGESEGAFLEALAEAKRLLGVVKDNAAQTKAVYQDELKPALQDLRTQSTSNGGSQ